MREPMTRGVVKSNGVAATARRSPVGICCSSVGRYSAAKIVDAMIETVARREPVQIEIRMRAQRDRRRLGGPRVEREAQLGDRRG